jgi:hypothetical protein
MAPHLRTLTPALSGRTGRGSEVARSGAPRSFRREGVRGGALFASAGDVRRSRTSGSELEC